MLARVSAARHEIRDTLLALLQCYDSLGIATYGPGQRGLRRKEERVLPERRRGVVLNPLAFGVCLVLDRTRVAEAARPSAGVNIV
jgi:hypothetical protein